MSSEILSYIHNMVPSEAFLKTAECTRTKLMFQALDGREVVGWFGGGEIASDAGGVLFHEKEQQTGILGRLSECFIGDRNPDRIEYCVEELIKQRVLGRCLGYEGLNDDELCRGRLLALLCDRDDLTGESRRLESDHGKPLEGKSTLHRLEWIPYGESRA